VSSVASLYFDKPPTWKRRLVAKVLQSTALKCNNLVVETQPHMFQPPVGKLDLHATAAIAANKFVYRSDYQMAFGLQYVFARIFALLIDSSSD